MLRHLHIRDFVIVETLELELRAGMTALTGETGAGKSILIDALGLTLGERADTGAIRQGCERAEVSASFDLAGNEAATAWLDGHDLVGGDGECVLRRVVPEDGRSRAFVNGTPVPVQQLLALGELLVDVHGQHEHQSLLRPAAQLALLDGFANASALAAEVRGLSQRWRDAKALLNSMGASSRDRLDRLDLLRFQVQELEGLEPGEDEMRRLDEEHRRLTNADRLLGECHRIIDHLSDGEEYSALSLLERAATDLEKLRSIDDGLGEPAGIVQEAVIQVREAVDELRRYASQVELDPGRLQEVEQRISVLHDLARKHRVDAAELPARLCALREELGELDQADARLERLGEELREIDSRFRDRARELSERRLEAAGLLSKAVSDVMQSLAMEGGQFSANVDSDANTDPSPSGFDRASFLVSANPGQALQPIGRVASGGELSRIALAIQVITADSAKVPTLIFDEVDSGIGGGTAEVVGRLLQQLGETRQVLCVTHLPQVAARAHHQLGVEKQSSTSATLASIRAVEGENRVEELARMLGGIEITANTLAHAREMMEQAHSS